MKVILVPQWLKRALEYANLNLSTVADLKTLTTILSTEDVAKYLHLNEERSTYVSQGIANSFGGIHLSDLVIADVASDKHDKISNQMHYLRIKEKPSLEQAWLGRDVAEATGYSLSAQLLGSDTLIITPILGQAAADAKDDALRFMDQLIGLWVSVASLEQVAPSQIFKEYLSLTKSV
jgi:hypothetical protein